MCCSPGEPNISKNILIFFWNHYLLHWICLFISKCFHSMPDQNQNVPWRNLALLASLCLPRGGPPGCGAGGMHDLCWGWPRAAVFACRRAAHLRLLVTGGSTAGNFVCWTGKKPSFSNRKIMHGIFLHLLVKSVLWVSGWMVKAFCAIFGCWLWVLQIRCSCLDHNLIFDGTGVDLLMYWWETSGGIPSNLKEIPIYGLFLVFTLIICIWP